MLNKRTGCESRTVPPLYVLRYALLMKVSHWIIPGRQSVSQGPSPTGTSQKTYALVSPTSCVYTGGVFVAEKRLRHQCLVPQPIIF